MSKILGMLMAAQQERTDEFVWVDPKTGQAKTLRSIKVLLPHGDGTITRESISIPDNYELPALQPNLSYAFPVIVTVSRKSGRLNYTLRRDLKPFPAPQLE
jgi:hypothetical protein